MKKDDQAFRKDSFIASVENTLTGFSDVLAHTAQGNLCTMRWVEQRSLAMHCVIAEKLRQHPELWDVPKETLEEWRSNMDPRSRSYLDAWKNTLEKGPAETIAIMIEDSEEAALLRKSAPFAGVLSPKERWAFLDWWKDKYPRATP